ncbi:hypothetical protein BTHERMOSOX_1772 [Bathymodiolus thermophilus thioautotrophic gill symbiont]|uniref:Uncharacterized protein n=1 Tax=Bathymodiolus thermophilus thioautotrophic gill symbiont TaxID=2360 RepID=A0A1J5U6K9_9GAMM|nr:hypothetical protein [Bathymodiolus thermophilus thioautotrophic gill symbiont]OIR24454.1 hypothetical protein BGC33_03675 [Bathymodiolus thermophilus thioautotrophic gill symbiont]CAB5495998.1 hypothetical protein THERMOT_425 [Bathymodiolus thermophilus thioautotrophic gill symbiont]CAB5502588.1 hypothetical protein THERMOS_1632 [Bathymodiolus thermophilus thioautotrophic gill symbiont]SGZ84428.1 hypothetical protein BTHERMOSOX_1772 [Bathymodiolus thermophilus thioautotrophic gill symbiont]
MSIILFVYEGKKHERKYIKSLMQETDINIKDTIIETAFCNNIYGLCRVTQGFDTVEDKIYQLFKKQKLKALGSNAQLIPTREDISEIYLFFDYDGHVPMANNKVIKEMLRVFNNETEQGKLYISYPMLEALKDKKNCVFKIKNGKKYKQDVGRTGIHLPKGATFNKLTLHHLKKANFLVNGQRKKPNSLIKQHDIFNAQLTKHISPNKEVAVLSALPLFYLDYKGVSALTSLN